MEQTFVALGSNIGDSQTTVTQALARIQAIASSPVRVSDLYRTGAITPTPQNDYLNAVCSFYTALSPYELLYKLRSIERELGQLVKSKEAPRIIDLDILFYGDIIVNDPPVLEIPHPRWKERLFVVAPLYDLLPTPEVKLLAARLAHQRIARIDDRMDKMDKMDRMDRMDEMDIMDVPSTSNPKIILSESISSISSI